MYVDVIEKLRAAILQMNDQLTAERKQRRELETKLRGEICEEMMSQIVKIENYYE